MRSVIAVLGGFVIFTVLHSLMETMLVRAVANAPLEDIAAYIAVRNRPWVAAAQFIIVPLAAVLAGYMTAKLARAHEIAHAGAGAAVLSVVLIRGFMGENAPLQSVPLRALLVVAGMSALTVGAYIRGQARLLQAQHQGPAEDRGPHESAPPDPEAAPRDGDAGPSSSSSRSQS